MATPVGLTQDPDNLLLGLAFLAHLSGLHFDRNAQLWVARFSGGRSRRPLGLSISVKIGSIHQPLRARRSVEC